MSRLLKSLGKSSNRKSNPQPVRADFILSTRIPPPNRNTIPWEDVEDTEEYDDRTSPNGTFVRPDFRGQKQPPKRSYVGTPPSGTLRSNGSASSVSSSRGSTLSDDRILSRSFPTNDSIDVVQEYSRPADAVSVKSPTSDGGTYTEPYDGTSTDGSPRLDFHCDPVEDIIPPDYTTIPTGPSNRTSVRPDYISVPTPGIQQHAQSGVPVSLKNTMDERPSEEYEDPWEFSKANRLKLPPELPRPNRPQVIPIQEPKPPPRQKAQARPHQPCEYESPWDLTKLEDRLQDDWRKSTNPPAISPAYSSNTVPCPGSRFSADAEELLSMSEVSGLKHIDYGKDKFKRKQRKNGSRESMDSIETSSLSASKESLSKASSHGSRDSLGALSAHSEASHVVQRPEVRRIGSAENMTSTSPDLVKGATSPDLVKDVERIETLTQVREISVQTDETLSDIIDSTQPIDYEEPWDLRQKQRQVAAELARREKEGGTKPGNADGKFLESDPAVQHSYDDSGVAMDYDQPWDLGKQQLCLEEQFNDRKPKVSESTQNPTGSRFNRSDRGSSKNRKSYKVAVSGDDAKMYEFYDDPVNLDGAVKTNDEDTLPINLRNRKLNSDTISHGVADSETIHGDTGDDDSDISPYSVTLGKTRGVIPEEGTPVPKTRPYKIPVNIPPRPVPRTSLPKPDPKAPADLRPLEDYDDPWDRKLHSRFVGRGKGKRESQFELSPFDDQSPDEDYEAGWDIGQERKSATMGSSDSYDGYEKPIKSNSRYQVYQQQPNSPGPKSPSPSNQNTSPNTSGHSSTSSTSHRSGRPGSSKSSKAASNAHNIIGSRFHQPGEAINASIPLHRQCWFHGAVTRNEAETSLTVHKDGSYLVRNSESNKNNFSLSLKSGRSFIHMKIVVDNQQFVLGEFSQPFPSIPEMIQYYTLNKLPIKGAEHMCLLHPVATPVV